MRAAAAALLLALAGAGAARAQAPAGAPAGIKKYWFVLLRKGPNQKGTTQELEALQKAHLGNIERLKQSGKLAIAGPFDGPGSDELRGLFILDVPTRAEAEALVAADPAVKAGRLKPQVLEWWAVRGQALP